MLLDLPYDIHYLICEHITNPSYFSLIKTSYQLRQIYTSRPIIEYMLQTPHIRLNFEIFIVRLPIDSVDQDYKIELMGRMIYDKDKLICSAFEYEQCIDQTKIIDYVMHFCILTYDAFLKCIKYEMQNPDSKSMKCILNRLINSNLGSYIDKICMCSYFSDDGVNNIMLSLISSDMNIIEIVFSSMTDYRSIASKDLYRDLLQIYPCEAPIIHDHYEFLRPSSAY